MDRTATAQETRDPTSARPVDAGPFCWLDAVADHGPPAGAPLVAWLWSRRWVRTTEAEREDILQTLGCTLLGRASAIRASLQSRHPGLTRGPKANRVFAAYVHAMAMNQLRDLRRRPEMVAQEAWMAPIPPHGEGLVHLTDTVRVIEEGWDNACLARSSVARALEQLRALTFESLTMDELVHEVVGERPPPGEFRRVRDRLYMQHRRARAALRTSILALAHTGTVDQEQAATAARWADEIFVRRRVRHPAAA